MHNIDQVIKVRKTQKVLSNEALPIKDSNKSKETIDKLLELASYSPYHLKSSEAHRTKELNSCVPWRCYTLDSENCRLLLDVINEYEIKTGKIANLLAATDTLIITTWLPDLSDIKTDNESEPFPFEGNLRNMEHIAAASTAIQNILLGATSREIPNYWSSGGKLRDKILRDYLNIPLTEILLGAIFLFPKKLNELNVTVKDGALRNEGKDINTWSKEINL